MTVLCVSIYKDIRRVLRVVCVVGQMKRVYQRRAKITRSETKYALFDFKDHRVGHAASGLSSWTLHMRFVFERAITLTSGVR